MTHTPPSNAISVILTNVSKSYPPHDIQTTEPTPIIKNLSFEIPKGGTLAITGQSGSGKTTLLNIMGALLPPDSGDVIIDGDNISQMTEIALARFRNEKIGFLFQEHNLLPQCDVIENILIPTMAFKSNSASKHKKRQRALELLNAVGLHDAHQAFPEELSGGEKQRVALVRALINEPSLLLADEPTGSLDAKTAHKLAKLIFEINHTRGTTLIIATHSTSLSSEAESQIQLGNI